MTGPTLNSRHFFLYMTHVIGQYIGQTNLYEQLTGESFPEHYLRRKLRENKLVNTNMLIQGTLL